MTTFEGPPLESLDGVGSLTLGGVIQELGARFASNEAIVFDDPLLGGATVRWSYADLLAESERTARALMAAGVAPGERVGILMGNRPEAVAGIFGAALAGAVAVPLSTFATPAELSLMLDAGDIGVLLTQDRLLSRRPGHEIDELDPPPPSLRHVAVLGTPSWDSLLEGTAAVTEAELSRRAEAVEPDDDGLIIFSSGTTSEPKGVLHRHRAPSLQMWVQAQIFGRHQATRMWTSLPIFWTAGLNTAVGATLAAGGCWVAQETFEPAAALALMVRERVTEPYTLPHQTAALAEHPEWPTADLSALRCVYGKSDFARHPSVQGDPDWVMPAGYGLSETCAFFFTHWWDTPRELTKTSLGRLLPGNRLRILDFETGKPLGPNEEGELALAGPTLMLGYLGHEPKDCFDVDGFFHTGDAGLVDDEGYVHFTGRRTEMIKTGGANVSPAELEVQLRACTPVKLSRVVGIPDDRNGELVVACVTLKDGVSATEDDIRGFLRRRVASYKVPKRVLFFDDGEIPMTSSATKVRDADLLHLVQQRIGDR